MSCLIPLSKRVNGLLFRLHLHILDTFRSENALHTTSYVSTCLESVGLAQKYLEFQSEHAQ